MAEGKEGHSPFLHFPRTLSLGAVSSRTGSACLSQSLTLGGQVQLLLFLFVKAAAAAAPSKETLPESLSPPGSFWSEGATGSLE